MPKYKYALFTVIIAGFITLLSISVIMTYPRYQKTIEQLPELIEADASITNSALLKIRQELDEIDDAENIIWTGSVCASKYKTLSGSERIYYVCPYIVSENEDLVTNEISNWSFSLRFLISELKDDNLVESDTNISVLNSQFDFRVGEKALITSVGYGDGEMNEVNGSAVSYMFRDRNHVNEETNLFARLTLSIPQVAEEEESKENKTDDTRENSIVEEVAVVNWSFTILEQNHEIGLFDDVQIEIPYQIIASDSERSQND